MPEWLQSAFPNGLDMPLQDLAQRLAASLLLGCAVAGVYRLTRRPQPMGGASLVPTLVLLTVLICMVTVVIGNSVARAFSLVGALAIVRFRTVVEDTRDTAFVIFAVGVGMALGAGFLVVPLVGVPVAAVAAFLFRLPRPPVLPDTDVRLLTVRIGTGHEPDGLLQKTFDSHLLDWHLTAAVTARQGVALDLSYAVHLRPIASAVAFVAELNRLEGVQSVELRCE
jgi:uncharacterized membrane protein YhiD involved in acid resistance